MCALMFQAGKRLGRRHLRMILTAVGRDCLEGTNSTREKVRRKARGDVSGVSPSAWPVNLRHTLCFEEHHGGDFPLSSRSITSTPISVNAPLRWRLPCDFACTMIQVDALVQVILPESSIRPTATSSAGEHPRKRPPVLAPAHDAGLDQAAKLATVMAALEAQQAEIEALKLEKEKLRETVGVTTCCVAKHTNPACLVRRASLAPTVHRATGRAR